MWGNWGITDSPFPHQTVELTLIRHFGIRFPFLHKTSYAVG